MLHILIIAFILSSIVGFLSGLLAIYLYDLLVLTVERKLDAEYLEAQLDKIAELSLDDVDIQVRRGTSSLH